MVSPVRGVDVGRATRRPSEVSGIFVRPQPGDVLRIDERASVQFRGDRALVFRVTAVPDRDTYDGWIWLAGYVLDQRGEAIERREVFVQLAGLRRLTPPRRLDPSRQPSLPTRPNRSSVERSVARVRTTAAVRADRFLDPAASATPAASASARRAAPNSPSHRYASTRRTK